QRRQSQEPEHVQTIVDGDDDESRAGGPVRRIVLVAGSNLVAAAMNEDNDGKRLAGFCARRPVDIQIEAVFAPAAWLRTFAPLLNRIADRFPARSLRGRLPSKIAHGRGGIGDAEKLVNSAIAQAEDQSLRGSNKSCRRQKAVLPIQGDGPQNEAKA